MELTEQEKVRFWSKVDKTGDCWEWMACKFITGYGAFGISGKIYRSHRIAWALTHRYCEIPPGMCVLHACDNPGCVNPRHLFLGTNADNSQDMKNKGRAVALTGEDNRSSKLTEKQVLEIRSKYIPWKYSQPRLAKEYGVVNSAIYKIVHRKTWKHI